MTSKARSDPKLKMRIAGGLVKHLGLQMYSGAVPAIAELVSNAWDAMAQTVHITLPLDRPLTNEDTITVADDGHGMTFAECNDEYLVVGRDRRRVEGDLTKPYGELPRRPLMSRKGIGKLAGFGIANRVEVRTVSNRKVTHFALDFQQITHTGKFVDEYEPELLQDNGKTTREPNATVISLTEITLRRSIPEDQFRASMARRFTVLTGAQVFRVEVNARGVQRSEQPFQFRFPKKRMTWETAEIPGVGAVKWWMGFRSDPIPDEEARGISVFARGKLAQSPWFFGLSGGAYGQHGMQYMTGEVIADFLDSTEGPDFIATDRGSVLWEEPGPTALQAWGEAKIRELLRDWAAGRSIAKTTRPEVRKYLDLAQRLPTKEREIFERYVSKVTSIAQIDEDDIVDELVKFGFNALTNLRFLETIRQFNAAAPGDWAGVADALEEWNIIEAIQTAITVKGRVEIIRAFEEMIASGVPEKPDMHEFLKKRPWLIDPQWETLEHERRLDTLLIKQFKLAKTGSRAGKSRVDFFSLAAERQWEVVELKRPGEQVGKKELDQIRDYVYFLREEAQKTSDPRRNVNNVGGILVYSNLQGGLGQYVSALRNEGIYIRTWHTLLSTAERLHKDYLAVVKRRAPADDPRISELDAPVVPPPKAKPGRGAKK